MTQINGLIKRIFDSKKIGVSLADEKTMKKYNKQFDLKVNHLLIKDMAKYPIESFRDIYDALKSKMKYPDK